MTVTRLAAVGARGRGQVDYNGLAGDGPCPVQPPPARPRPRRPRRPARY